MSKYHSRDSSLPTAATSSDNSERLYNDLRKKYGFKTTVNPSTW